MSFRKNSTDADVATDGTASHSLRELGEAGAVSRRGVIWRAGLATVGGVAALSVLDAQRADAVTGSNFVLGASNNAGATTLLTPTAATNSNPLLQINGAALSATSTTMIVDGPAGGAGLAVEGASTSTTVGLAILGNGAGTATGVVGSTGSGTGVAGNASTGSGVVGSSNSGQGVHGGSNTGVGVYAASNTGTALYVSGKTHFSRAGVATITSGHSILPVTVPGLASSALVLVTLQSAVAGVYVLGVVPSAGHFTVHLSKNVPSSVKIAWFVISG